MISVEALSSFVWSFIGHWEKAGKSEYRKDT